MSIHDLINLRAILARMCRGDFICAWVIGDDNPIWIAPFRARVGVFEVWHRRRDDTYLVSANDIRAYVIKLAYEQNIAIEVHLKKGYEEWRTTDL